MANEPSRQMRGAGNPGQQPVQFTLTDAQRIATVVGHVESERRQPKPSSLPRNPASVAHYLSKTYRTWPKDTSEILYIYAGEPLAELPLVSTNETVVAWNHFGDVAADQWVILGRANGTFYLLGGGGGGGVFRGTYQGAWPNDGTIRTVTEDLTGDQYDVANWLTPISGNGGKCVFGAATGEYVLISFDLTDLDGYTSGTCVLGSEGAALKWFDTVICT